MAKSSAQNGEEAENETDGVQESAVESSESLQDSALQEVNLYMPVMYHFLQFYLQNLESDIQSPWPCLGHFPSRLMQPGMYNNLNGKAYWNFVIHGACAG